MRTTEQREKDLTDGAQWSVNYAWGKATTGFEKDLKAPLFLKCGDMAALTNQYDELGLTFRDQMKKKGAVLGGFGDVGKQVGKLRAEADGLKKELDDIVSDSVASLPDTHDTPEAAIALLETSLKQVEEENKERKAVFDRWLKIDAAIVNVSAGVIAKAKKDLGTADAGLKAINDKLNSLEKRIRDVAAAYSNTATSINRQDIASAVRKFLAIFAKA